MHSKEWIDYCEEKFDFHKLFDVHSYSYVAKISKPHPIAFQNVLKDLSATPEECLFIDDSNINIQAAKSLNIPSILFTDAMDLEKNLKQILPHF